MISRLARTYLLLAALIVALVLAALAANRTLGTYKLNVANSTCIPALNPVRDLTVTRELSTAGIMQTTDGTLAGNVLFFLQAIPPGVTARRSR